MENSKKVNGTKEVKKVTSKKANLNNLTDEQLLNINLDEVNVMELLSNNKALQPKLNHTKDKKESMFNYPIEIKEDKTKIKNFRTKARKKRNSFIESLLTAYENKNVKEQKEVLKAFNIFYKETYLLNDYSIQSISRLNADKNTLAKIKIFFHIIKKLK